jgi:hypothetical protein
VKILRNASILLIVCVTLSACKKYPDGPGFTLLPKVLRLCHNWKTVKELKNGVDITSYVLPYIKSESFNISRDQSFSYEATATNGGYVDYTGTWSWSSDKSVVYFSYVFGPQYINRSCVILKLEEKEFWEQEVNSAGDLLEYHYAPN